MPTPAGFRALRHRDFRLFWTGQLVSLIGTWMQRVGEAWLVLELTNSPFLLGLIGALQFGPMLCFSFVAGVAADRLPKRRLILGTQTALMLQAFCLTVLVWSGHVRYWHVAVLALLYGLANTLDMPTRQAFIVEMVGETDLLNAIALNSAVFNGARIVGPAVAGLLVARYGEAIAFFLNGLSFLAVILALLAVKTRGLPQPREGTTVMQEIKAGIRYAAGTPRVALILSLLLFVSLLVINHNTLVPLLARDVLHAGAHGFGLLMAALGGGAVTGAVALALWPRKLPFGVAVAAALVLAAAILSLAAVRMFWPAMVLLGVAGLAQIVFTTSCNTTLQLTVPNAMRGRMMSLYAFVFVGVTPFGSLLVGTIAEFWGVPAAFAVGGGLGLLTVLGLAVRARRNAGGRTAGAV